jgi:hypothetical protein
MVSILLRFDNRCIYYMLHILMKLSLLYISRIGIIYIYWPWIMYHTLVRVVASIIFLPISSSCSLDFSLKVIF